MRVRLRTIRSRLFVWYSLVIVALLVVFTLSFSLYTSRLLRDRAARSGTQLSAALSSALDAEIATMNKVSVNVAFSSALCDTFLHYVSEKRPAERFNLQASLSGLLFSFIGPLQPVYQLNLYDLSGRSVGAGFFNAAQDTPLALPWFGPALDRRGAKLIVTTDHLFVSLCRVYYDRSSARIGFIEVQQLYDVLFGAADEVMAGPSGTRDRARILVFDDRGALVYPRDAAKEDERLRSLLAVDATAGGPLLVRDPSSGERELLSYSVSELSGWSVASIVPERILLAPIAAFTRSVAGAGILGVILTLAVSFLLARRLSAPINRIYRSVEEMSLTALPAGTLGRIDSGIDELDALSISFKEMCARLGQNVEELLRAKSQEMKARMLALQSQMNPHFLYNTISTISVLAEEGLSAEIVGMCHDLSRMLRYVSSLEPFEVRLGDEIAHAESFLRLMERRYEGHVASSVDVPPALMDIPVPKLSVQPLVENSLRHGIHVSPPWKITIGASCSDGRWTVAVRDSGSGFGESSLASIRRRMAEFDAGRAMPDIHVEGMGIISIYLRLRILYGEAALLRVGNAPGGGALVEFGAPLER